MLLEVVFTITQNMPILFIPTATARTRVKTTRSPKFYFILPFRGMENLDSPPITFPYLVLQKSGSEIREV